MKAALRTSPSTRVRHLERQFPQGVRQRGAQYFSRGRVKLVNNGEDWIEAEVLGDCKYLVAIEPSGKSVAVSCTCPYYEDWLRPCKHVWASILAASSGGQLPSWLGSPRTRLRPRLPDDLARETRTPKWKRQMATLRQVIPFPRSAPASWPSDRQIVYLLDADGSTSNRLLRLEVKIRDRLKDGSLGKTKAVRIPRELLSQIPLPDRRILSLLIGMPQSPHEIDCWMEFYVPIPAQGEVLPLLCDTGRFFLKEPTNSVDIETPLRADLEEAWTFNAQVHFEPMPPAYIVTGSFCRGPETLELDQPTLLLEAGLLVSSAKLARLEVPDGAAWVRLLRSEGRLTIPQNQAEQWVRELVELPTRPPFPLPPDLHFELAQGTPQPVLIVKYGNSAWERHSLLAQLWFAYEGEMIRPRELRMAILPSGSRRRVERDQQREGQIIQELGQTGFQRRWDDSSGSEWAIDPTRFPGAAMQLLDRGWRIEAEGKPVRKAAAFDVRVVSGIDWFELQGHANFDGSKVALPTLLRALKNHQRTILLDDGSLGLLPEHWLKRYGVIGGFGKAEGESIRFRPSQAGLLDALLAAVPEASCDQTFENVRRELCGFEGIVQTDPPKGFRGSLRDYQRTGLGWLQFLRRFGLGGCLADDMGLGKTVQVLALLEQVREARSDMPEGKASPPSLVVVPRSLMFNWVREASRFAPSLRICEHVGKGRSKIPSDFGDCDVVLTTYGTLRRDATFFHQQNFEYAILDEAQAIKTASSASAKAARLLKANHRLALSGTPIENHLGELWSLFEFLNPGMLGSSPAFRLGQGALRNPDELTRGLLARALRPFILRRTKAQVATELPKKSEQTLYCEMEGSQRRLYDELRAHYRSLLLARIDRQGIARSKIQILEALLRLRQAALHPGLIDKELTGTASAKLEVLVPQLEEVSEEGHKALVFSQFTSMLAILRDRLAQRRLSYAYLDGSTRDRATPVQKFQDDPACRLFLISLKAGGLGLNLTAAEYVFLLDPWWNPAVEAQAIDRTHRIGQTRSVFAYRLIARDTVEERVLELQERKRSLADAILNTEGSLIRDLKPEDVERLLA